MSTPAHLGGHGGVTHIDSGALDAIMWKYEIRSLLDIGCGPGGMRAVAEESGLKYAGVDGDASCNPTLVHDFSTGPLDPTIVKLDGPIIIWSVEFLEHVYERDLENVFPAFSLGSVVFLTHALPNSGGHHHVNERGEFYWIEKLYRVGFHLDVETTHTVRTASTMTREFCRNTGKVFYKTPTLI